MPLTIKKCTASTFAGKRGAMPPGGQSGRTAPEEKKPRHSPPETYLKITFYLLLGLIYFVKVK